MLTRLEPDDIDLYFATYIVAKSCPFCGDDAGSIITMINETSRQLTGRVVYRATLACRDDKCAATISANAYTKMTARNSVLVRWNDRRPKKERERVSLLPQAFYGQHGL